LSPNCIQTGRTDLQLVDFLAMKLILKVEDVFDIAVKGLVLTPSIPDNLGFAVRPKDLIQLRTPDGRVIETHIDCFGSGRPRGSSRRFYDIVLPRDLLKKDVPIGTEVWLVDK
jgi:hypothetical protein